MSKVICRDLTKTFHQGEEVIHALDEVNLEIPEGSFICLSGPSGSGKTTLLNVIGGLDKPDSGSIEVAGDLLDSLNKSQMAALRLNHIGFVFQAYNLIPVLSARENIEFVMEVQGVPAEERHKKSTAILEEVDLAGMENRLPSELSGGQQQRVAVARAVVSEPALVLADEPTANLDSVTAEKLMELFDHLNREHGITFVISTHDPRVMAHARRLIKMRDGKIVEDATQ
jgi:putative ABC transport system ATP-binding protein